MHRNRLLAGSLSFLALLTGCGFHGSTVPPVIPDVTGNWQMQSSTGGTNAGVLLLGSLTSSGANVSGVMRFANLSLPNGCGTALQPVQFFGNTSVAATSSATNSGQTLQLVSQQTAAGSVIKVNLSLPTTAHNLAFGSIEVDGNTCSYPASGGGIGAQIAAVNGAFTGTISSAASLQSSSTGNGTATLTLTQAATPQADGQYPLTGTLGFTSGSCNDMETVTGLVSGAGATLASAPANGVSNAQLTLGVNPSGLQIEASSVTFAGGPCFTGLSTSSTYSGTLTKK